MKLTKTENGVKLPASAFLVVDDPESPSTWALPVRGPNGKLSRRHMGAAWAALHEGHRGQPYKGPGKAEAIKKLTALYAQAGLETPADDYKEYLECWKELPVFQAPPAPSFSAWIMPGLGTVKEKAEQPPSALDGPVDPNAVHLRVGKALARVGLVPSTAIDTGEHAEAHGSAWKMPLAGLQAFIKMLWGMGYRGKGKGKFSRGPVVLEVGQAPQTPFEKGKAGGTLFVYITDDNGPGPKQKPGA